MIAARMNTLSGTAADPEHVLITSGSQQGLDLSGKLFLDEGDAVLCESPTYLGAVQAFARLPAALRRGADRRRRDAPRRRSSALLAETPRAKLIYVVPDFQNPTGRTWSLERRRALVEVARRHGVVIVEDHPYDELRFEGDRAAAADALDPAGEIVFLGTFSKIFCPGMRIGWLTAPRAPVREVRARSSRASTCTPRRCRSGSSRSTSSATTSTRASSACATLYRRRRDAMLRAMERGVPAGVTLQRGPHGGLFLWVELPASGQRARPARRVRAPAASSSCPAARSSPTAATRTRSGSTSRTCPRSGSPRGSAAWAPCCARRPARSARRACRDRSAARQRAGGETAASARRRQSQRPKRREAREWPCGSPRSTRSPAIPFTGNPAAVVVLGAAARGPLDAARRARDEPLGDGVPGARRTDGFRLRWFTPAVEVDLCGHATLASAHVLWDDGVRAGRTRPLASTPAAALLTAARERRLDRARLPGPARARRRGAARASPAALGVDAALRRRATSTTLVVLLDERGRRARAAPDFARAAAAAASAASS